MCVVMSTSDMYIMFVCVSLYVYECKNTRIVYFPIQHGLHMYDLLDLDYAHIVCVCVNIACIWAQVHMHTLVYIIADFCCMSVCVCVSA